MQVRPPTTEPFSPWSTLYVKGAPRLNLLEWHQDRLLVAVYLDAGAPVANELGAMTVQDPALVPRAGERVVLTPGERRVRVRATRARSVQGTLDGAVVPVSAKLPYQEVGVRFRSEGEADVPYALSAEATGATEWRAVANPLPFVLCRSCFCDCGTSAILSPDVTSHYPALQAEGRWMFLVAFAAGQTGTVSLRLAPTG